MSIDVLEVSDTDLAALVGLTARRIRQLATEEKLPRCGRNKYRLGEAVRALLAVQADQGEGTELQKERLLKLRAERQIAELNLARETGLVGLISDFQRVQTARNAIIQANVMQVSTRAVLRLLGEVDEAKWKAVMKEELTRALKTAAEADLDLPDDEDQDHAEH